MTIRLARDGVTLRPFDASEFDVVWEEETRDRGDFDVAWSPGDDRAKERVRARVRHSGTWREQRVLDLAIEADGRLVGDVQARRDPEYAPPGLFDLGIALFRDLRGRGVGTLALSLLTQFLFDEEDASRVFLSTDVDNVAMQRSAEKAGFTFEGVMRGFWTVPDAPPRDYALYARTRADHLARCREPPDPGR
jgi:RimJ/RimL family protein N-acetyltransferase